MISNLQLNADHDKTMDNLQREINELHDAERRKKQEELKVAEDSQRLVSGLETDLQQLLEDKKALFKVSILEIYKLIGC